MITHNFERNFDLLFTSLLTWGHYDRDIVKGIHYWI